MHSASPSKLKRARELLWIRGGLLLLVTSAGCERNSERKTKQEPPDAAAMGGAIPRARAERVWFGPAKPENIEPTAHAATDSAKPNDPTPTMPDAPTPTTPDDPLPDPAQAPTSRVFVAKQPSAEPSETDLQELSVSEVRELYISSEHTHLAGEHRELRRFYAPSGDLYYEKLLSFSTEIDAPVPFLERVTIPHSKQIAAVTPDALDRLIITDVFPVAGTWISDRELTGTWRMELYLDAAPQPTAAVQFELVP